MISLIENLIEAIARSVRVSREAMAATLEEIAVKVRAGDLIPEEAFAKSLERLEEFDEIERKFNE